MIDETLARVAEIDEYLDPAHLMAAFVCDLDGRSDALWSHRTDPIVDVVLGELVALILQPLRPTSTGWPSSAADRRVRPCRLSFEEGYVFGRIALDTHRLVLHHSGLPLPAGVGRFAERPWTGLSTEPPTPERTAAGPLLRELRRLALSERTSIAFLTTTNLAPFLGDLTAATRSVPADLALQFAALGFLTAVGEWTLVLAHDTGPHELSRAHR